MKELRRDNLLRTELFVAKELHMSLGQLRRELTYEELWIWVAFITMQNEDHEKAARWASLIYMGCLRMRNGDN